MVGKIHVFNYESKNIILNLTKSYIKETKPKPKSSYLIFAKKGLYILDHKTLEKEFKTNDYLVVVVTKKVSSPFSIDRVDLPLTLDRLLDDFIDIMLDDLFSELLLIKDI